MKIKTFQILNIIGMLGVLIVNTLANTLPIAGKNTGELSDLYPSLFTPAGITFSIWGIIYLLLIIFTVYQAKGIFGESNIPQNKFLYRMDIWFFVSSLANMVWIFAWHHQIIWLSMVLMLVILGSLLLIYLRLGIGLRTIEKKEKYLVHLPFSVYLAWITVATIANAATVLISYHWSGFGISANIWTDVMISVTILITLVILFRRNDLFFGLVIIWALIGIIYKRYSPGEEFYFSIVFKAASGIFLIAITILYQMVKGLKKKN